MKYEIITVPGTLDRPDTEHVLIEHEDGSFKSIPVDESNPEYIQFIKETKEQ